MNAYPGFPGIVVVIPDLQEDVAKSMCSATFLITPKPRPNLILVCEMLLRRQIIPISLQTTIQ